MHMTEGRHRRPRRLTWRALGIAAVAVLAPAAARAQAESGAGPSSLGVAPSPPLPFVPGEALVYGIRVGALAAGRGTMWVEGPEIVRGVPTLLLRSQMSAGVGPLRGRGQTDSWLDPERMASMRFEKDERRLLSRYREAVDVFPGDRRWTGDDGRSGVSPTDAPLDELSFIYFVRTISLAGDSTLSYARHFEMERNPIVVRVLGREPITTPAGTFATVLVEMRVKDPRHYKGDGIIRIHLMDDPCRIPVRIESNVPSVGKTVLTLERVVDPGARCLGPQ